MLLSLISLSVIISITYAVDGTTPGTGGSDTQTTKHEQTKQPMSGDCMPKFITIDKTCSIYYCIRSESNGVVTKTEVKQTHSECLAHSSDCLPAIKQIESCKNALYYASLTDNSCTGANLDTTVDNVDHKGLWPVPDSNGYCHCPRCIKSDTTTVDETTSGLDDIICCKTIEQTSSGTTYKYERAKKGDCQASNQLVLSKEHAYKCDDTGTFCPAIYQPVCDSLGNEYPNECIAKSKGVTEVKECPKTDISTDTCGKDPVCYQVSDGQTTVKKTFESECALKELYDPTSDYCKTGKCVYTSAVRVSSGPCVEDKDCYIDESYLKPVCDKLNKVTYSNLRACKCAGACQTDGSYLAGRCSDELSCRCPKYITNTKPFCFSRNDTDITIYKRCRAMCDNIVNVDTSGNITPDDDTTIIDGRVCPNDENDCIVRTDTRINCDESSEAPKRPNVKLSFKFKMCYPETISREQFFNIFRQAADIVLYKQCGLTRLDTDKILIVKFIPDITTLVAPTRGNMTKDCKANDGFTITVGVYVVELDRARKIAECIKSFATSSSDIREIFIKRFKEIARLLDPNSECTGCKDDVTCNTKDQLLSCDKCTNCIVSSDSDVDVIGGGTYEVDTSVDAAMTIENGDGTVESSETIKTQSDSSAFVKSVLNVFIIVIAFILVSM